MLDLLDGLPIRSGCLHVICIQNQFVDGAASVKKFLLGTVFVAGHLHSFQCGASWCAVPHGLLQLMSLCRMLQLAAGAANTANLSLAHP